MMFWKKYSPTQCMYYSDLIELSKLCEYLPENILFRKFCRTSFAKENGVPPVL